MEYLTINKDKTEDKIQWFRLRFTCYFLSESKKYRAHSDRFLIAGAFAITALAALLYFNWMLVPTLDYAWCGAVCSAGVSSELIFTISGPLTSCEGVRDKSGLSRCEWWPSVDEWRTLVGGGFWPGRLAQLYWTNAIITIRTIIFPTAFIWICFSLQRTFLK